VRRSRLVLIGLAVVLMGALVAVVGTVLRAGERDAMLLPVRAEPTPEIPLEAGVFRRQDRALDYAAMPAEPNTRRRLAVFYARRAYPGAPPVIPHHVEDAQAGGKACLSCHADGGWAPKLDGYAPVVPHCQEARRPFRTPCRCGRTVWRVMADPAPSQRSGRRTPPG
jgi:cytochrome c-type protein NapB